MEIIDLLDREEVWQEFFEYKKAQANMKEKETEELWKYIENKEYLKILPDFRAAKLPYPRMKEINKNGVNRKRIVFLYERELNYVLKLLSHLLKRYDDLFSRNLYSFRTGTGVKKAIYQIRKKVNFKDCFCYKVDIHDYFNSVDIEQILFLVRTYLPEEPKLFSILKEMLENPYAYKEQELVKIKKGIMAGVPTSGFLANLYLKDLDEWFWERGIPYIRYSDDIIVFAKSEEKRTEYEGVIKEFFAQKNLTVNPKKEVRKAPGEHIEFLGFDFSEREINVSDITVKKLKDKLRRKAKSLYRWKIRKGADNERTVRAYIRLLNRKYFDNHVRGEITWCRWYFPVLTTDEKLKVLDKYAITWIRYLCTGKHGKKNFDLRYERMKELGFRSLVNAFWKFRQGKTEKMTDRIWSDF